MLGCFEPAPVATISIDETWYEKLGRWEDALDAYERKQAANPGDVNLMLGRMRCLKSLGEWQRLYNLAEEAWLMDPAVLPPSRVAPLGARAAWALGKWDAMLRFVSRTHEGDLQVRWQPLCVSVRCCMVVLVCCQVCVVWAVRNGRTFVVVWWRLRFLGVCTLLRGDVHLSGYLGGQGAFFRAVLCIHRNRFDKAERFIETTRGLVANQLSALAGESYNR